MDAGALLWVVAIGFFYLYVLYQYLGLKQVLIMVHTSLKKNLFTFGNFVRRRAISIYKTSETWYSQAITFITRSPIPHTNDSPPTTTINIDSELKHTEQVASAEIQQYSQHIGYREAVDRMDLSSTVVSGISWVFCFMFIPFIGQWMFWVGFVELARDR